jgi:hypothetical protein
MGVCYTAIWETFDWKKVGDCECKTFLCLLPPVTVNSPSRPDTAKAYTLLNRKFESCI